MKAKVFLQSCPQPLVHQHTNILTNALSHTHTNTLEVCNAISPPKQAEWGESNGHKNSELLEMSGTCIVFSLVLICRVEVWNRTYIVELARFVSSCRSLPSNAKPRLSRLLDNNGVK